MNNLKNYIIYILFFITNSIYAQEINITEINSVPPESYRGTNRESLLTDVTIEQYIPAYSWSYGCASTAVSMLVAWYDNHNYKKMYADEYIDAYRYNTFWNVNGAECPISATHIGIDGRTIRGHVEDYWTGIDNIGDDPFIVNSWTEHSFNGECVGDYMGTNQDYWNEADGHTAFVTGNGSKVNNFVGYENSNPRRRDGCHGLRLFIEARLYSVSENYNQCVYGYNGNTTGFTWEQYKNEIIQNRPVLIGLEKPGGGHMMLAYGYNEDNNHKTILLHNTWNLSDDEMEWDGTWEGFTLKYVTVIILNPPPPMGIEDWVEITGGPIVLSMGETVNYNAEFHSVYGNSHAVEWNWYLFLEHSGGDYVLSEFHQGDWFISNWENIEIPTSLPNYDWVRNNNGNINGRVSVGVLDSDGYYHGDEFEIELLIPPPRPTISNYYVSGSTLIFSCYSPGADGYNLYYDVDSGPPYSGISISQGSSPIDIPGLTTFQIVGAQECIPYYFAIKAYNDKGESEYTEELELIIFPTQDPLLIKQFPDQETITENATWDDNRYFAEGIIIEPGVTLIIQNGNLFFSENANIIIKPTGKLILDNTLLTGICEQTWRGIEVWGNRSLSQYDSQGNLANQGQLFMNKSVIENAINAVELWHPNYYDETGGIIFADSSSFINNAKSIHAVHYKNFNPVYPTHELNYCGRFTYCNFEINENYLGDATFYKHVDLYDVNGINFEACNFSVAKDVEGVDQWNIGIASYDAGFSAVGICQTATQPCQDYVNSTFTGFYQAVYACNHLNTYTFRLNNTDFSNNTYGVNMSAIHAASILNSNFQIGTNNTDYNIGCLNADAIGIYSELCSGFAIEENNFSKWPEAPEGIYLGIWINNTNATDEVYKNYFSGLSYANYSEGHNWEEYNTFKGLAYFCNENQDNYADFYVGINEGKIGGIQSLQGDINHVTGNTFTQNGARWHFYNGGNHLVGYFYCDTCQNEIPDYPSKTNFVMIDGERIENTCPSHYGGNPGPGVLLSIQARQEAELAYANNLTYYNNVESLYENLVDGGSTETELTSVQNAQPEDMWDLRAQLLGDSPHLSMVVLKEVADRTDVFTDAALFDILAANPDELKKDELIKYLEDKENPLPEYMIDILVQVAEGTTYKTVLQEQMAMYNRNKTRAANDMIRNILSDSITDYNSLRNWLDNLGGLNADRQIIASYIAQENYTDALSLANMLPELYAMEGIDLIEQGYYLDILDLYFDLNQSGNNFYQLDSSNINLLFMIADSSNGIAGIQAKSILEANGIYHTTNCPCLDSTTAFKRGVINPNTLTTAYGLKVTVKPNPANQWASFEYTLPNGHLNGTITISSAIGEEVKVLSVSGQQGQILWDTREIPTGVYFYVLKAGNLNQAGKIIINN